MINLVSNFAMKCSLYRCAPALALVTTAQASIQTMTDRGIPIMQCCPTSSLLMSKSIVDASLMRSDWPTVAGAVQAEFS